MSIYRYMHNTSLFISTACLCKTFQNIIPKLHYGFKNWHSTLLTCCSVSSESKTQSLDWKGHKPIQWIANFAQFILMRVNAKNLGPFHRTCLIYSCLVSRHLEHLSTGACLREGDRSLSKCAHLALYTIKHPHRTGRQAHTNPLNKCSQIYTHAHKHLAALVFCKGDLLLRTKYPLTLHAFSHPIDPGGDY